MVPAIAIPFASEIHGKEYYLAVFDILRQHLSRYGVEIHTEVVTSSDEAERVGRKYQQFLPIALVLTGGTSKLIESFIDSGGYERLILFSHSEHNSLASAVSARSKAERKGLTSLLYHCPSITSAECALTVSRMLNVVRATSTVIGSKIGVIADRDTKNEIEELYESKFNATVHIKTFDQLLNDMSSLGQTVVNEAKERIAKLVNLKSAEDPLETIARLYLALKNFASVEGLDALTIDCFPLILKQGVTPCIPLAVLNAEHVVAGCEADLPALLGLIVVKALTGKSGWIANVVDAASNRLVLAHCTIALDVVDNAKVQPHFETGCPYALTGTYMGNAVTILSIDRDLSMAAIALAKVMASGSLGYAACRMQMILELEHPVDFLVNVAPNNHHVVVPGDHRKELAEVLYLLGLEVIDYREFWVPPFG